MIVKIPKSRVKPHYYVSTSCYHEEHDKCRHTCKYCAKPCQCRCHREARAREAS